jgi:hypothetical protein
MARCLGGLARALKPGGKLVVETAMAAESILPALQDREWFSFEGMLFAVENRYDASASRLETEGLFVLDGKAEKHTWCHYVYTTGEIRALLAEAGFDVLSARDGFSEAPYALGARDLVLVARRR